MKNCVRKLRRSMELSQEALAGSIGVSRHTIIGIEKETQEPSGLLIMKIAEFFNKDPREIFFIDGVVCSLHSGVTVKVTDSA